MKSLLKEPRFPGAMVVVFFLGIGMIALTQYFKLGFATTCLAVGFFMLMGAKETSDKFSKSVGIIGFFFLAISGILFAIAL